VVAPGRFVIGDQIGDIAEEDRRRLLPPILSNLTLSHRREISGLTMPFSTLAELAHFYKVVLGTPGRRLESCCND
jgi:hypothetical protein